MLFPHSHLLPAPAQVSGCLHFFVHVKLIIIGGRGLAAVINYQWHYSGNFTSSSFCMLLV